MAEFNIAGRQIGDDHPPIVIAEIGINHEGCLDTAIAMADAAISVGAEIIKHQTHVVEDEMSDEARKVIPGNADVSIYEIMERCALSEEDERKLMQHIQSRGSIFISTPFSRAAAERLATDRSLMIAKILKILFFGHSGNWVYLVFCFGLCLF